MSQADSVEQAGEDPERPGTGDVRNDTSFGEFMRRERLRHSLTIDEMGRASRIPVHYLEALEEEDFEKLPPRIYVRGFLDAFARKLALSADDIHGRYEECLREQSRQRKEDGAIFALFRPQGTKFQWRDWIIPLFLASGLTLFAAAGIFLEKGDGVEEVSPPPPPAKAAGQAGALPVPDPAAVQAKMTRGEGGSLPAAVKVVIRADADTSVAAERDGGERAEMTLQAGETREVTAAESIVLILGDAGAVRLNSNGRELGYVGHKGDTQRRLVFRAGGR